MNNKLFRQVSLERLSSPEQLDQLLVITSGRTWLALGAVLVLIMAFIVWSFTGKVVTTASGNGVVLRQGGVLNVVTNGGGMISKVSVRPGDLIEANEVVAIIEQPALIQQLTLLKQAREEAVLNRNHTLDADEQSARLKQSANKRDRSNVEAQVIEYRSRAQLLGQQIEVEKQLFAKGLVTNQQVLDFQQALASMNDQVAASQARLVQLDAERYSILQEPAREGITLDTRVADLDRQITQAREQLNQSRDVRSPYSGEVLEVKVSPGMMVNQNQPTISLQPREERLEVLAYVPALLAKDLKAGMEAQISPSNVKREEYGFMKGSISFVSNFPATEAAMMRNLENSALVQTMAQSGPVTEVRAELNGDPNTVSGFSWSTSAGPAAQVTSGTLCTVNFVTRREKPIALLFPFLGSSIRRGTLR